MTYSAFAASNLCWRLRPNDVGELDDGSQNDGDKHVHADHACLVTENPPGMEKALSGVTVIEPDAGTALVTVNVMICGVDVDGADHTMRSEIGDM
jgi:hypothetical protein